MPVVKNRNPDISLLKIENLKFKMGVHSTNQ